MDHVRCLVDPFVLRAESESLDYARYLDTGYEDGMETDQADSRYFGIQQSVFVEWFFQNIERHLRPLSEANIAFVGISKNSLEREHTWEFLAPVLDRVGSVTVADFSVDVLCAARNTLQAALDRFSPRPLSMSLLHHDITNGLAEHYGVMIDSLFDGVDTHADFRSASREFARIQWNDCPSSDLPKHLPTQYAETALMQRVRPELNDQRTFRVPGVDFHLLHVPMVLAGTGVTHESRIWHSLDPRWFDDFPTNHPWWHLLDDVYQGIANYNTAIASRFIQQLLAEHTTASVLVTTDIDTRYKSKPEVSLPRLHLIELCSELMQNGINVYSTHPHTWDWHDAHDHWHTVCGFVCERA